MKTAAIISEYNPFHRGHKYLIDKTREMGATHIVAIMSGNFVQRGDVAIADKFTRAMAAINGGVDLVLELPVAYSLSGAEFFAKGGIYIANALQCVDMLSFGSECGDIDTLTATAKAVNDITSDGGFFDRLKTGIGYGELLSRELGEYGNVINSPNNTLGVEYIRAIINLKSNIKPVTITRKNAPHDSNIIIGDFASAGEIRRKIKSGENAGDLTPCDLSNTADISYGERALICALRRTPPESLDNIAGMSHGLKSLFLQGVKNATDFAGLCDIIKVKNLTTARVRRLIFNAFLGITGEDIKNPPAYARILGMNDKGREILSAAGKNIPIDTSLSALEKKSKAAKRQAYLEAFAGDMYSMFLREPQICGADYTHKFTMIKE